MCRCPFPLGLIGVRQAGASTIEGLLAIALIGVSLGVAVPGFGQLNDRQRLRAVASQAETDVQHARGLAVAQGQVLRLSFFTSAGESCYVLHTGTPGQCQCVPATGQAGCSGSAEALRVHIPVAGTRLAFGANVSDMAFAPSLGTVTPAATLSVRNPRGEEIRLVVNVMGRVRSCSPTGLPGEPAC